VKKVFAMDSLIITNCSRLFTGSSLL
jgi:hypothetical protein